jgi:hypothetical protein
LERAVGWERGIVYVWDVLTHGEYNGLDLREIERQIEQEEKGPK